MSDPEKPVTKKQLCLTWGLAVGAVGMMAFGAFGKIQWGIPCLPAGAAIGYLVGVILEARKK